MLFNKEDVVIEKEDVFMRKTMPIISLFVLLILLGDAGLAFGQAAGGLVSTIAGTGGHGHRDGSAAQFNMPRAAFKGEDGIYIADTYNNLIRNLGTGSVTTEAGNIAEGSFGLDAFGLPRGLFKDGAHAYFNRPQSGITLPDGRVLVADSANHALRIIERGTTTTLSGGFLSVAPRAGHVDGRLEDALFNYPSALAIDAQGYVYIADALNHVIRRIDLEAGLVSTIAGAAGLPGYTNGTAAAAQFNSPMGIAVSSSGLVYVADTGNHLIRVIEGGYVRTLAGSFILADELEWEDAEGEWDNALIGGFADGSAQEAMFNLPVGLSMAHHSDDVLIVADSANHAIRMVTSQGQTTTIAGTGLPGHEDGPAQQAGFHLPAGVLALKNGDILIVDTGNNLIRRLESIEFPD